MQIKVSLSVIFGGFNNGLIYNDFFSSWQLLLSSILSTAYALIMMAVIVGTALQLGEDGLGSPSAIFLISLSGSFFIAALLHPQEFWCVVPGKFNLKVLLIVLL